MPQSADKIKDHELLFREPEYQKLFEDKKAFEFNHSEVRLDEIRNWTKTAEYKDKNFAREALTVNPAKACQPLGAVYVANGFHKTLSFVHGSQGCVAYYRSHFSRHFKEPTSCVSSSMTEDAAVFYRAGHPAPAPGDHRRGLGRRREGRGGGERGGRAAWAGRAGDDRGARWQGHVRAGRARRLRRGGARARLRARQRAGAHRR